MLQLPSMMLRWPTLPFAILLAVVSVANHAVRLAGQERPAWMEAPPQSTGIEVGKKIPSFQLPDQNNRRRDLASLRGPKGLALYFMRSVDW
jgi:hypothetical protein